MKIQFDPNLDFQREAINAVVDLFEGQEVCRTNFTVAPLKHDSKTLLPGMENDLGTGNRLRLLDEKFELSSDFDINEPCFCKSSGCRKSKASNGDAVV